jgi:hypothetical protein
VRRSTTLELLSGVSTTGGVYGDGTYGSGSYGSEGQETVLPGYDLTVLVLDETAGSVE